jgi:hypothetical protein
MITLTLTGTRTGTQTCTHTRPQNRSSPPLSLRRRRRWAPLRKAIGKSQHSTVSVRAQLKGANRWSLK